jgi:hypothetical protein
MSAFTIFFLGSGQKYYPMPKFDHKILNKKWNKTAKKSEEKANINTRFYEACVSEVDGRHLLSRSKNEDVNAVKHKEIYDGPGGLRDAKKIEDNIRASSASIIKWMSEVEPDQDLIVFKQC